MSNFTEILGIDAGDADSLADVYEGYAGALELLEDKNEQLPWVASSWLISALFRLTTEPAKATEAFAYAASAYQRLNLPIWRLCAICALGNQRQNLNPNVLESSISDEEQFYKLLQDHFTVDKERRRAKVYPDSVPWMEWVNVKFAGKVPKLNVPYSLVTQTLYDSQHWSSSEKYDYLVNFTELVKRISEFTELSQAADYHWKHLQGSIIPFEPAGVALIIVFLNKWLVTNSFKSLITEVKLNNSQQVLLLIVNEMLSGQQEERLS
ncbi:hypothetical protein DIU31_031880 [Mucilaginibacter rubeus]|uniref:Uncharacterized protein n=1 Tax=Mucilaginibacter rubeus TaxID=2027860 RepID=A0AAE6MLL7_9SPHI|nr:MULTISPECIES: hypothetical protein [Mucilaginibacter]QEM07881.1 hypothetical protein DIU31_031880 [Mucilaginibacter rubeus]QEM20333.1 hypothetical protein DIU38_031485 [Mucilaginibacter gossypii]QTE42948.1 hypothetical protein J3L19_29175 [Mucilaginibacter rubeus]QTE49549.1 hypothetical protein J3L21_29135 [Mucilaginibacter rubeus]QTE54645.1 hypothetical protein J3L23_20760 [Mucilaginibacter rubeus]